MIRNVDLTQISDGRLYRGEDQVRADALGCKGCSKCCHGMGDSIILDPYDIYQITTGCKVTFRQLLGTYLELGVVDHLTLPHIIMDEKTGGCRFLNEEGRCSIHPVRPGFCRLFPLGRIYDEEGFSYFLQVNECPKKRTKVKVRKWIGVNNFKKYETFVKDWHFYLKEMERYVLSTTDEQEQKDTSLYILMTFFLKDYRSDEDFYQQFYDRLETARSLIL